MLERLIPDNKLLLEDLKKEVIGIESKSPPGEDQWTESWHMGSKKWNKLSLYCRYKELFG